MVSKIRNGTQIEAGSLKEARSILSEPLLKLKADTLIFKQTTVVVICTVCDICSDYKRRTDTFIWHFIRSEWM